MLFASDYGYEFPTEPIGSEIQRGISIYRQDRGYERLFQEDRKVIGWWFQGLHRRETEEAIWLSPRLVSRILGYLDAKEKWPEGERQRRWEAVSKLTSGTAMFAVRLSSFPKINLFDDSDVSPNSEGIGPLDWRLTLDGKLIPLASDANPLIPKSTRFPGTLQTDWSRLEAPLSVQNLATLLGRERVEVEGFPWYESCPLSQWIAPKFKSSKAFPLRYSGPYETQWFWVTADLRNGLRPIEQFELRILNERKERLAVFPLTHSAGMAIL